MNKVDESDTPKTKVGYVALIGRPNSGKSTLLNRMIGEKVAITSDKPQTTRSSILGIKTTDEGQIIFIDNPGIHKPLHKLNRRMMNFVYGSLETADLLCLLIDGSIKFGHGDEFVIDTLKKISRPVFLLINKVDITRKDKILLIIDRYKDLLPFVEIIPISALTGVNLDVLEEIILKHLPEAEKLYSDDDITVQSVRFLISEIIREKVLSKVWQELPFTTAVLVDRIEDRETPDAKQIKQPRKYVKATIFVERDTHRIIILGKHGTVIKSIGVESRKEIQEVLDAKVYLDLHIKVRERWRDSADVLDLIEQQ
ncbi:GTPase Era [Acidobacteriota bacterium]